MRNRTLALIGAGMLAASLALGTLGTALAQGGPVSIWGPGGMMGGYGMMGGSGGGMMRGTWQTQAVAPVQSLEEAEQAFQAYLEGVGNPDLALREVMEFERSFYAIVEERSTGTGAFELLADRQTGAVFPEYGPNMMWNTRYGHMGGWGGMMRGWAASGEATSVRPEQAQAIAQRWLDTNRPGSAAGQPDAFYGYYTLHTERDGQITGMLSVNSATGQVWYHAWHGRFIATTETEH